MCFVNSPEFLKVLFTHVSEVRSAQLFTSSRHRLNGLRSDEHFQGAESMFPKVVSAACSFSWADTFSADVDK